MARKNYFKFFLQNDVTIRLGRFYQIKFNYFTFSTGIWIPDLFFSNEKTAAFHEVVTQSNQSKNILLKSNLLICSLTLRRPLRKNIAEEVVFDVSKVKESIFFKSDLTDPLRFLMRIFWNIPI